ncbi:protein NRT1/ PTR FAMILY 7.3 [Sesamum angolense]|uniref:Protein NRT1/ PTR FAMILY 7.3 n=1 Tax=Sesamum angolense TaxID=2727404 RepID=A0AAE2C6Y3_9LAMI|nr:protein NRT1/ PTR FAMILY 7.3 [Sesamum angolense]
METEQQASSNTDISAACNDSKKKDPRASMAYEENLILDPFSCLAQAAKTLFFIRRLMGKEEKEELDSWTLAPKMGQSICTENQQGKKKLVVGDQDFFCLSNADAAKTFSTWMGTLNICTLFGAFLSDSYLGRYLTCVVFQVVLSLDWTILSVSTQEFMLEPKGCGKIGEMCNQPSPAKLASFYVSVYLLALGSGAIEPALATLAQINLMRNIQKKINIGTLGPLVIQFPDSVRCLDRAAVMTPSDKILLSSKGQTPNPWHLCTVTQVEEVKCVLRLLPIWFCSIMASVVFVQVLSLFVEQGATMNTQISNFHIPPASMTAFDIISTSTFIICYEKVIVPLYIKLTKKEPKMPSELQRMGIGMVISIVAMIIAGLVEQCRLKYANEREISSLSIFWQIPQYVLVGVSEAFIYVAQWEFFASQIPDRLKSLGIGLSMSSSALGSYLCTIILTLVMKVTSKHGKPGWIPPNLNEGHLDRFFFLSAALIAFDLVLFITCANRFKCIEIEKRDDAKETPALP